MRHKSKHKPGGMLSDVVETDLGTMRYEEVKDLRQIKRGEWESRQGYRQVWDIPGDGGKTGVEINHDESGDRFLLLQTQLVLRRLDYDIGNSPEFGYENETSSTLTLPSGVTIPSGNILRFFVHAGVVRITGADVPLWYGYVNRNLFSDKLDEFYPEISFADSQSVPNWVDNSATPVSSSTQARTGTLSTRVTQTGSDGTAYRTFATISGESYSVTVYAYKDTADGSANIAMLLGSTLGGIEYSSVSSVTKDAWVELTGTFTANSDTLYVELNPGLTASSDVGYFDDFSLTITSNGLTDARQLSDWFIKKADLETSGDITLLDVDQNEGEAGDTRHVFVKFAFFYDDSQYSVLKGVLVDEAAGFDPYLEKFHVHSGQSKSLRVTLGIPDDLSERITGIAVFHHTTTTTFDNNTATWRLAEVIFFNDALGQKSYVASDLYYDATNKNRIWIFDNSNAANRELFDGYLHVGAEILISTTAGSMKTIITGYTNSGGTTYIELNDPVYPQLVGTDVATTFTDVDVKIYRRWVKNSGENRYEATIPINLNKGDLARDLIGFPATVTDNSPNYTHHAVIEGIAYVNTQEDGEEDQIRYSSVNQLDNFPVTNIFPTDFGTQDKILALVKRDNRLVIMKENLIGQGNFVNGQFFQDIESPFNGLFSDFGFTVIGTTLFYIDKDDVYQFRGVDPVPLLSSEGLRERYKAGITNGGLIFENKIDNELWIYLPDPGLNGEFLCWRPQMQEWYIRTVDYVPTGYFVDADRRLMIINDDEILTYDHENSTDDETVTWEFTLKLHVDQAERYMKKLHEVNLVMQMNSNADVQVVCTDEGPDAGTQTDEFTPPSTYDGVFVQPKFFYKQLSLTIKSKTGLQNMFCNIREIMLRIDTLDGK